MSFVQAGDHAGRATGNSGRGGVAAQLVRALGAYFRAPEAVEGSVHGILRRRRTDERRRLDLRPVLHFSLALRHKRDDADGLAEQSCGQLPAPEVEYVRRFSQSTLPGWPTTGRTD